MGFKREELDKVATSDCNALMEAQEHYGDSWKQRGGVGAFMMLARKWDRIENRVSRDQYNIFEAIIEDDRAEGVMDDIRDLRRYLILVEAEIGVHIDEVAKGPNPETHKAGGAKIATWRELKGAKIVAWRVMGGAKMQPTPAGATGKVEAPRPRPDGPEVDTTYDGPHEDPVGPPTPGYVDQD